MQIEHMDLQRDQGHRMKPKPLPSSDQQHLWVVFHMSSMPTEQISGSHAAQLYYNMQNKIHGGPTTWDRKQVLNKMVSNWMIFCNKTVENQPAGYHCIWHAWISNIQLLPEEIFNPIWGASQVKFDVGMDGYEHVMCNKFSKIN